MGADTTNNRSREPPSSPATEARKGYALNKMCYSFNQAENRAAFKQGRGCLLRQVWPERAAARGDTPSQRARPDRRRRQCLLPGQVRRHLRTECAGSRRTADRHDRRGLQAETRRGGEIAMAQIIGSVSMSHIPMIGMAINRGPAAGPVFQALLRRLRAGAPLARADAAGRGRDLLQRPRPQLLPRQDADLRDRRGPRVPECRRGLGPEDLRAPARRSGAVVEDHRRRRRGRVRRDHLPGIAGGPRLRGADRAAVAQHEAAPGARRADHGKHGAASAALGQALPRARPGRGPRDRGLREGPQGRRARHGRHVAPARRRRGPATSTATSTTCASTA